jgi:hypothetical protein
LDGQEGASGEQIRTPAAAKVNILELWTKYQALAQ